MPTNTTTDFTLPKNAYATFDALSLKSLIKDRLSKNSKFTSQDFEGSNMSALIDVIAYSYHVLLFYLNQTATESLFTEAELYENMNRIVKSLDYKPIGYQTSIVAFNATAVSTLPADTYTIPRYSRLVVGNVDYSFKEDITFTKTTNVDELLSDLSTKHLLYQGKFIEYPKVIAVGEEFETITLVPGDDVVIDHFNIHVYIKDEKTRKWAEWVKTASLFLENSKSRRYEVRLNENKRYEIKFGNNIYGTRLNAGDEVAVYYLESSGKSGEIGTGVLNERTLLRYSSVRFVEIFNQIKDTNIRYLDYSQLASVKFSNNVPSSEYYSGETVEDIRNRAPKVFTTQHRLVTKSDYENFIKQSFNNVLRDVKVVNNAEYLSGHFKYNFDILGASKKEPRTVLNNVNFADACDFNNLYCYGVPRVERSSSAVTRSNYLSPSQKHAILVDVDSIKTLTTEILIIDPVYVAAGIGVYNSADEELTPSITDKTILNVYRKSSSTRSIESIQSAVNSIILEYFRTVSLGHTLNVSDITSKILSLDGVVRIQLSRTDRVLDIEGINFIIWNPVYPDSDITVTGSSLSTPYFKYIYLNDPINFVSKIKVLSDNNIIGTQEY